MTSHAPPPDPPARTGLGSVAAWPFHLIVPAATITIAAGALLTFAAPKTVIGVRLYGGATEHGGRQTIRFACLRRETGVIDGVALDDVALSIDGETQTVRCDREGQAEVPVRLAGGKPVAVQVKRGAALLAAGEVSVSSAKVRAQAVTRSGQLRRASFHGAVASGFVPGGALVLGRATTMFVQVRPTDEKYATLACPREAGAASDADGWKIEALGADVIGKPRCGAFGWEITVSPTFTTAQLTLIAKSAPAELLYEAQLPIVAAPIVADLRVEGAPGQTRTLRATVRSNRGAEQVHVRIDDRRGRRFARTYPLNKAPDGQSFTHLTIELEPGVAEPADEPVLVVGSEDGVAGSSWAERLPEPTSPTSPGESVRAVDPAREIVLAPSVPWLDGLAPLASTEAARTTRARGAVGFFVLAGALLEVVLVLRRTRAATRAFQAHLQASAEGAGEVDLSGVEDKSRLSSALVAVTLIAFGFAIIGLVVASQS